MAWLFLSKAHIYHDVWHLQEIHFCITHLDWCAIILFHELVAPWSTILYSNKQCWLLYDIYIYIYSIFWSIVWPTLYECSVYQSKEIKLCFFLFVNQQIQTVLLSWLPAWSSKATREDNKTIWIHCLITNTDANKALGICELHGTGPYVFSWPCNLSLLIILYIRSIEEVVEVS